MYPSLYIPVPPEYLLLMVGDPHGMQGVVKRRSAKKPSTFQKQMEVAF